MSLNLDEEYWDSRYVENTAGWDIGYPAPAIAEYIDQIEDKNIKVLIPGCGNSYEGEYLHKKGFTNITLLDHSTTAKQNFLDRCKNFDECHFINEGFFEHQGKYDLIIEQTFFCALDPKLREDYAKKMNDLLVPGGKLTGLLFDDDLNTEHPPFGGHKPEYLTYFAPYFSSIYMEPCHNSIPQRAERELFFILKK